MAGDIADDMRIIDWTLRKLRSQFSYVFYAPGNHELWVRNGAHDSVEKFRQILSLCNKIGIYTQPGRVGKIWIVPLFLWYESNYDLQKEADVSSETDMGFCNPI